jgi:hypothetical protein
MTVCMRGGILSLQSGGVSVIVEEIASTGILQSMRIVFLSVFPSLTGALLASAMALAAMGQSSLPAAPDLAKPLQEPAQVQVPVQAETSGPLQPAAPVASSSAQIATSPLPVTDAVQQLLSFKDADVRFSVRNLMSILRDSRHEGWVLAAYPDPKTGHPLIGAGFTLDLPAREHPQMDQLNPHPFIEPSSAELWQAAGLDAGRLHSILDQFDQRLDGWSKKGFRRKIRTLSPQITDEDANLLLRMAVIQAAYNAKGYCRDFDRLSASQQMALTQLVYQMGYNLQEFSTFLGLINGYSASGDMAAAVVEPSAFSSDGAYWKTVQQSLVESQWARLYRVRAVSVIAMLDPEYSDGPRVAEQRVGAMLHPAVAHRHRGRTGSSRQVASRTGPRGKGRPGSPRAKAHQQRKRSA